MFLKNRNFSSKIKRSKVTDYAALKWCIQNINQHSWNFHFSMNPSIKTYGLFHKISVLIPIQLAAKDLVSLHICADLQEPLLLAYTKYGCRWRLRPKIRHILALLGRFFVCLFCCFTSQVNSYGHGRTVSSPNHTFSWASLNKQLTSTSCTYFPL